MECRHCGLVHGIEVKLKMIIVTVRLVEGHQVPSYYDTVLCSNSRLLHSTVKKIQKKKKKKKKKWQALSPGSEVLTTLNRLSVTRSWNWSTWANGDLGTFIPFLLKWAVYWVVGSKTWGRESKSWGRESKVGGEWKISSIILYKMSPSFAWKKYNEQIMGQGLWSLWQYVASGLCNHLRFPRIVQW